MKFRLLVLILSVSVASLVLGACGTSSDEGTQAQPETSSGEAAQTGGQQGTAAPTPTIAAATKPAGTIQFSESAIAPADAAAHLGQESEVCGFVAQVIYEPDTEGRPTYLRFDQPAPDQTFTVLIEGKRRPRWASKPENYYPFQQVCAKGTIVDVQGGPGMVVGQVFNLVVPGGAGDGIVPPRLQQEEERKKREAEGTKVAQTKEAQQ